MTKVRLSLGLVVWMATSVAFAEINDGLDRFVKPKPPASAAPAPAPVQTPQAVPNPHALPPGMKPAPPAPARTQEGKVIERIDGAGYTYLQLEAQGQRWWVAGTQVKAQKGDKVRVDENVVMEQFHSKTLNKTFDRIIFASAINVVK